MNTLAVVEGVGDATQEYVVRSPLWADECEGRGPVLCLRGMGTFGVHLQRGLYLPVLGAPMGTACAWKYWWTVSRMDSGFLQTLPETGCLTAGRPRSSSSLLKMAWWARLAGPPGNQMSGTAPRGYMFLALYELSVPAFVIAVPTWRIASYSRARVHSGLAPSAGGWVCVVSLICVQRVGSLWGVRLFCGFGLRGSIFPEFRFIVFASTAHVPGAAFGHLW
jgi:hypothetical protein